ncbi:hypothetical protein KY358_01900 [Candidatus Woesearchaeota archaeon]|nr:hypothetical protein [Candidatus Woesearchaeota archaeon]
MPGTKSIKQRLKKLMPNILLAMFSILVCVLILEAFLRITMQMPDSCSLYKKDDILVYKNRANLDYTSTTKEFEVNYHTNDFGLREYSDYRYKKKEGIRVLTVGDSFTFGIGLDHEDTFQKLLEQKLKNNDINASVINAGVSGYGSKQALELLRLELKAYQPDLVIFSFYNNDVNDDMIYDSFTVEEGCLIKKDMGSLKKNLYFHSRAYMLYQSSKSYLMFGIKPIRDMLYKIRNSLIKINLAKKATIAYPILYKDYSKGLEAGWIESMKNIKEMDNLCKKNDCTFILAYIPSRIQVNRRHREDYLERNKLSKEDFNFKKPSQMLAEFSKKNDIIYIDLWEGFDKMEVDDENIQIYYSFDPHFNKNGSDVISSILYDRLREVIN